MKLVDTRPNPKPSDNTVAVNVTTESAAIKMKTDGFRTKNDFGCRKVLE